jgi:hypothetical protein
LAVAAVVSGCGGSPGSRSPDLGQLPLVGGVKVVAQVRECDPGANAYCSLQLVVVGPRYRTSDDLIAGEHDWLLKHGWTGANADTGSQHAADSPGHKVRVTYATAFGDLYSWGRGFIKRDNGIALALSHQMYAQSSAMSLMLEVGPS